MIRNWRTVGVVCLLTAATLPLLCETVNISLRLDTPLTSYGTKPGTGFEAIVTAPVEMSGRVVLPAGTVVRGTVRRAVPVGMGLVRERAAIDLDFDDYELSDGSRFPLRARLVSVENARETVSPQGRILGILAANNPQSLVHGIWFRPGSEFLQRSAFGLTGASGRVFTEYSMGPIGGAALLAIRFAMFRMPEPEIRLPRGTEMRAVLTGLREDSPSFAPAEPAVVPGELAAWLHEQPFAVYRVSGEPADDIANVVFIGSRDQLEDAFAAAGWSLADPRDRRSLLRAYNAYTSQHGYPSAPVSKLYYHGSEPDLVFQKSLNTLSKRHHIRIWAVQRDGETVWIGAATQDIGVGLDSRKIGFTHKIDPAIDTERAKIVSDLDFAGCSDPAGFFERPEVARGSGGKGINTDGRVAVVHLRDCAAAGEETSPAGRPGSWASRSVRRGVLETRNYLVRGNAYYWTYRAVTYRRKKAPQEEYVALFRPHAAPIADLAQVERVPVQQSFTSMGR